LKLPKRVAARALQGRVLPTLVFVVFAGIVLAVGVLAESQRRVAIRRQVQLATTQATARLRDFVGARLAAADSLREQMATGPPLSKGEFQRQARVASAHLPGLLALNWIDRDGVIRWVYPEAPNHAAQGRNIFEHPHAASFARQAFATRTDRATRPIPLFQGKPGFATYLPLPRDAPQGGAVNAVFDVAGLVKSCFHDGLLDDYELCIDDTAGPLFESPGCRTDATTRPMGYATMQVLDRAWTVRMVPSASVWERLHTRANLILLVLGLLLAVAVSAAVHIALSRQRRLRASEQRHAKAQRQLQEAQKMEALGRLAGGVAHDFNNTLTAVIGHGELALDVDGVPEEVRDSLREIVAAGERAAGLAQRLLAFARQQPSAPRPVAVAEEVRHMESLLRPVIRRDIALEMDLDEPAWQARIDPVELDQIVTNLVINAADAMPNGGSLRVEVRNIHRSQGLPPELDDAPADEWVRLSIRDTGEGIAPEVLTHIFEPFYTTKPLGGGTGLGLATVESLVTSAGGTIEVESALGEGTTFHIWLPREPHPTPAPEAPKPTPSPDAARRRILLAEDDADVREVARQVLAAAGHEVVAVSDGAAAIRALEREPFDLVVTDLVMPRAGGAEVTAWVHQRLPGVGVVICSGYSADTLPPDLLSGGRTLFLRKPIRPEDLLVAVEELGASVD